MKNNLKIKYKKLRQKLPKINGKNGEEYKFTKEELDKALLESFDLMQRVLLDTTYVVVGDTARSLKEKGWLNCDGIDCIIEKRHVTPFVISTFKEWATPNVTEKGFEYKVGRVPVRIKFIKRKYDFFKYPDIVFHDPEIYRIPNQFDKYYRARFIIR